jgi:hypothetical protein
VNRLVQIVAVASLAGFLLAPAACQARPAPGPAEATSTVLPATEVPVSPTATTAPRLSATWRPVEATLKVASDTPRPINAAKEMRQETGGGGQIIFDIRRSEAGYDVHVTSYQFRDRDVRFAITEESGEIYRIVSEVMQDQSGIRLDRLGAPTGSWTTLRFSDGEHSQTYENVVGGGSLRSIYDYVVERIGGAP